MCITIWRESAQRNERGSLCNALTQTRSLSSGPIYKGNSAASAYIESPERDRRTRRRVESRDGSRGGDERPVRTGERRRHGLDRRAICFGGFRKVREVVDEAEVHDAVGQ